MNLNELLKEWDTIVENSMGELDSAKQHALNIYEVAETDEDIEEAKKVAGLVEARWEQVQKVKGMLYNKIKELALLMHHYREEQE